MALKLVKTDMPFTVMSMEADRDYILARMISFVGAGFHARAGYLAQMACEKYLKALTIQNEGIHADNTHKLLPLAELCKKYDPYFAEAETKRILGQFDAFDQVGRYGGAAKFDPLSIGRPGSGIVTGTNIQVKGVMIWEGSYLNDLDSFVFKTRGLLDHARIKTNDALKSVLDGDTNSYFVLTWKFPIPIRDVLTHGNKYFGISPPKETASSVNPAPQSS